MTGYVQKILSFIYFFVYTPQLLTQQFSKPKFRHWTFLIF